LHSSGDNEQLQDLLRLSPQRKPEEEVEDEDELERDDLRPGIASYPDHEALEHRANYDLSIEKKMIRRSSPGFARYLVAILIGVAVTLAWQSYGDVAKQIAYRYADVSFDGRRALSSRCSVASPLLHTNCS